MGFAPNSLLTIPQAAARSGIASRTLRDAAIAGNLPASKLGRDWLIAPGDLDYFSSNRPRRGPKPKSSKGLRPKKKSSPAV